MIDKLKAHAFQIVAVALVVAALWLWWKNCGLADSLAETRSALTLEQTQHNATRRDYARDKGLWLFDQRNANATIAGLQRQANATAVNRAESHKAELDRFVIFSNATTQTVKPAEVVDDATCRAAAVHINSAFRRASGL